MIATSTLTRKNQTTLPKAVVAALGVKPSDRLIYEIEDNRVTLRARTGRLADLAKIPTLGPKPRQAFTSEEIDSGIGRHLAEEDKRIRRQWHKSQKKEQP